MKGAPRLIVIAAWRLAKLVAVLACALALMGAARSARADTCTNCTTTTVIVDGVPCTVKVCTGPNWPACLDQASTNGRICSPGISVQVAHCTGNGSEVCTLTCSATGTAWTPAQCVQHTDSVREQTICKYDCPRGADGTIYGRATRILLICTSVGPSQVEVSPGTCGDAACTRSPSCVLAPGQTHCPTPTPRPTATPGASGCNLVPEGRCAVGPGGANCALDTLSGSSRPACPAVSRNPFPRGLVGVPNHLCASGFTPVNDTAAEDFLDAPRFGNVVGYRIQMQWMPSVDDPVWVMDERAWNVGQTSDDIRSPVSGNRVSSEMSGGMQIREARAGMCVDHIFETSSYEKPANAPGWPNLATRQPGYQVQLVKRWQFQAQFVCRVRVNENFCVWPSGVETDCPDHKPVGTECVTNPNYKGCLVSWREREVIRDEPHGAIDAPDIDVAGARVGQDTAGPSCGVISIPVISSQAIVTR